MAQTQGGTWSLGWTGVREVVGTELRRYGAIKWVLGLGSWILVFGLFTGMYALTFVTFSPRSDDDAPSVAVFGFVVLLVLLFAALAGPLQSGSLDGDHANEANPPLAPTSAEVVIGKLIAGWLAASSMLVAALPLLLWTCHRGGTPVGRLAVSLGFIALLLLTVGAIGLGCSVLTGNSWWSLSWTFLTVLLLTIGLPEVFGLTRPLVTASEPVSISRPVASLTGPPTCQTATFYLPQAHTERTWWLLAASPFLAVADAAPVPSRPHAVDPLTELRTWMRDLRLGPSVPDYGCPTGTAPGSGASSQVADREALAPSWPWSVLIQLGLTGGFAVLAIRKLGSRATPAPENAHNLGPFAP